MGCSTSKADDGAADASTRGGAQSFSASSCVVSQRRASHDQHRGGPSERPKAPAESALHSMGGSMATSMTTLPRYSSLAEGIATQPAFVPIVPSPRPGAAAAAAAPRNVASVPAAPVRPTPHRPAQGSSNSRDAIDDTHYDGEPYNHPHSTNMVEMLQLSCDASQSQAHTASRVGGAQSAFNVAITAATF